MSISGELGLLDSRPEQEKHTNLVVRKSTKAMTGTHQLWVLLWVQLFCVCATPAQWGFSPCTANNYSTLSYAEAQAHLRFSLPVHSHVQSPCLYFSKKNRAGPFHCAPAKQDEILINVPSTWLGSLSKRWKSKHYSLIFSPTRITLMLEGRPYLKSAAWGCKWTVMYLTTSAFCQGKHPEEREAARWLHYQSLHLCPRFGCLSCYNERPLDDSTQHKEHIQNNNVFWHSGANLGCSPLGAVGYLLIYLASKRLSSWLQTYVKNRFFIFLPVFQADFDQC